MVGLRNDSSLRGRFSSLRLTILPCEAISKLGRTIVDLKPQRFDLLRLLQCGSRWIDALLCGFYRNKEAAHEHTRESKCWKRIYTPPRCASARCDAGRNDEKVVLFFLLKKQFM